MPRSSAAAAALLLLLGAAPAAAAPTPPATSEGESACLRTTVRIPLLGGEGDSPIVPVAVQGQQAAMFFSPGFVPVLFRNNGPVSFKRGDDAELRTQDGLTIATWMTNSPALSIGSLPPVEQDGYLLDEPDVRAVAGRPLVGMLGREVLAEDVVIDLDIPGRSVTISLLRRPRCAADEAPGGGPVLPMEKDILKVPVRINGRPVDAVLEPDLPVSVIPRNLAARLGITETMLDADPSVRTKYATRVRGHRHKVESLEIAGAAFHDIPFDVEDRVDDVMLGLNVFSRGEAVFDLERGRFSFRRTRADPAPPGSLHFDETKVSHVEVAQGR